MAWIDFRSGIAVAGSLTVLTGSAIARLRKIHANDAKHKASSVKDANTKAVGVDRMNLLQDHGDEKEPEVVQLSDSQPSIPARHEREGTITFGPDYEQEQQSDSHGGEREQISGD